MDLISRQAVLDSLKEHRALYCDNTPETFSKLSYAEKSRVDELDTAIATIINLPSVENKGEWIPVSERLPLLRGLHKISDDVLITNGFEIDMGYLVKRKGKIVWHYYGSEYEVGIKDEDNDARAWMPLPEPYKAESEDI